VTVPNPNDRPSQFFPHASDPAWPFRHVCLFCDRRCGAEIDGDFRAEDLDQAYAGLRKHAAANGWTITDTEDVCPRCTLVEGLRSLVENVRHILATSMNDWGADRAGARLYGIFFGWDDGEYDAWEQLTERHRWTPGVVEQLRRHHATVEQLLAAEPTGKADTA
jgi:hypothetical protein